MDRIVPPVRETPGDARIAPVRSLLRGSALTCDDVYAPDLGEAGSAEDGPARRTRHERPEENAHRSR